MQLFDASQFDIASSLLLVLSRAMSRPVGRPSLGGKGRHRTKHIIKSVSVAKKMQILSFWDTAPLPKMRHTIAHF